MQYGEVPKYPLSNPVEFFENLTTLRGEKLKLYSWQKAFLLDKSNLRIIDKARQIGISTSIGMEAIYNCVWFPNITILFVSTGERSSKELMEAAENFLNSLEKVTLNFKCKDKIYTFSTELIVDSKTLKKFKNGSRIISLPNNPECYDDKTEILTNRGWVRFPELKDNDKVAQIDKNTLEMSFVIPDKIVRQNYNGIMYDYHRKNLDFSVTPNHRMLLFDWNKIKRKNLGSKIVRIDEISKYEQFVAKAFNWKGKDIKSFITPQTDGRKSSQIKFNGDEFCKFMGIYLAEGCTGIRKGISYDTIIYQYNNNVREDIENFLKKIPVKFYKDDRGFKIFNKNLTLFLKQFGTSQNKFVPDIIKNSTPRQIRIFLDWYFKGDGDIHNNHYRCTTISKQLIDDIQEMELRLGNPCSIKEQNGRIRTFPNGRTSFGRKSYTIWEGKKKVIESNKFTFLFKKYLEKRKYDGKIYCVSVPKKFIVIRRNGIPLISGNTVRGYRADIVYIDEFAHFDNSKEIWEALLPSTTRGGKVTLVSTPKGKNNEYYRIWDESERKLNDFKRLEFVVEKPEKNIGNLQQENYTRVVVDDPELIVKIFEKKVSMTQQQFDQEYHGIFVDESVSYFPYELIRPCINEDIEKYFNMRTGNPVYIGIDFSGKRSSTVVTVAEKTKEKWIIRPPIKEFIGQDRIEGQTAPWDFSQQIKFLESLIILIRPTRVFVDQEGPGIPLTQTLQRQWGGLIQGISLTNQMKERLLPNLRILFENQQIEIPKDDNLIDQLHSLEKTETAGGYNKYKHSPGKFDDYVMSLALAVSPEERRNISFTAIGIRR